MAKPKIRKLTPGFTSEVDSVDEQSWCRVLGQFDDANIYQTWSHGTVIAGRRNLSHLILRENGNIVAIAQARISKLPVLNIGIAYVFWGPLWRCEAAPASAETFRQAVRALRNEFVCRRGLTLRLFPMDFDEGAANLPEILADEGFSSLGTETRGRTIIMDVTAPLEDLRNGMQSRWRRYLKATERNGLEVVAGSSEEMFETFIRIYKEMVSRKKFVEPNDINQFLVIQRLLPDNLKMKILLCSAGGEVCAGAIYSTMGKTAVYIFGATSDAGLENRGSYLLQWKIIEDVKLVGAVRYNLNGINPDKNPGAFKFKSDLAGTNGLDLFYIGRFDAHGSSLNRICVEFADSCRAKYRALKKRAASSGAKPSSKPAVVQPAENLSKVANVVQDPEPTSQRQM
jgi:hypothetical protein